MAELGRDGREISTSDKHFRCRHVAHVIEAKAGKTGIMHRFAPCFLITEDPPSCSVTDPRYSGCHIGLITCRSLDQIPFRRNNTLDGSAFTLCRL